MCPRLVSQLSHVFFKFSNFKTSTVKSNIMTLLFPCLSVISAFLLGAFSPTEATLVYRITLRSFIQAGCAQTINELNAVWSCKCPFFALWIYSTYRPYLFRSFKFCQSNNYISYCGLLWWIGNQFLSILEWYSKRKVSISSTILEYH